MTCETFIRWLDDGRPEADRVAALAHGGSCASCAEQLAAAEAIDTLLVGAPAAPRGFADRIMARVAVTPQERPSVLAIDNFPLAPAIPWWARVALEPVCVLAVVLGAVLLWRGSVLTAAVTVEMAKFAAWAVVAPGTLANGWLPPTMLTAATFALAPLVFLGSQQLYRWSATLVGPRHVHLR